MRPRAELGRRDAAVENVIFLYVGDAGLLQQAQQQSAQGQPIGLGLAPDRALDVPGHHDGELDFLIPGPRCGTADPIIVGHKSNLRPSMAQGYDRYG
jgi:hypothetical protein